MRERWTGAPLYWCDPEKHVECDKRSCSHILTRLEGGVCEATYYEEYAMLDESGKPMIYEVKKQLKERRKNRKERKG